MDYFEDAAKFFPVGYQRVFLEQRGTGKSRPPQLNASNMSLRLAVEDLEVLRKHLGLERLTLAGHSWGGMLAMAYAASHADRVERLILIGFWRTNARVLRVLRGQHRRAPSFGRQRSHDILG